MMRAAHCGIEPLAPTYRQIFGLTGVEAAPAAFADLMAGARDCAAGLPANRRTAGWLARHPAPACGHCLAGGLGAGAGPVSRRRCRFRVSCGRYRRAIDRLM